jgi:hypothetical protein
MMKWAGQVERMEEMRNAYRTLVGVSKGKTSLERLRYSWENIIKMYHLKVRFEDVNWFRLVHDRAADRLLSVR